MKTIFKTQRGDIELERNRCLANDVIFSDEFNPHNVRPWIIGNEYGALCLVWASHEQDAFDAAADADMIAGLTVEDSDVAQQAQDECEEHNPAAPGELCDNCPHPPSGVMLLGNASEPFDSNNAWIELVQLTPRQERSFAEARGANLDTIDDVH